MNQTKRIPVYKKIIYQLKKIEKYGTGYFVVKLLSKLGIKTKKSYKDYIYKYYSSIPMENLEQELVFWYESTTWKNLNLKEPKTFNEKLQWLKLYDTTQLKTNLADKFLVREWVKNKIGEKYLVNLLGVWDSFSEIDFDRLPTQFVLKCNHGSGMNVVVTDKSKINLNELRKKFDNWMGTDFFAYNFEPHYYGIKRKIIAEEYMSNSGDDLYDYKFWCNNGKCDFIMFLSDRKNGLRMANFDRDWNLLPFVYDHEQCEDKIMRPDNLEEMLALAEKLAEQFYHVRVDFYRLNDGTIKFGELTFTSMSGIQTWMPEQYDEYVGSLLRLPTD